MKKTFRGALSSSHAKKIDGWIVVPVVALREGVIHASNSSTPELVLAKEFGINVAAWNGKPVMIDHPTTNGVPIRANAQSRVGIVNNARVEDKSLKMDVWLQESALEKGLAARILAGDVVDVSVGVVVEVTPGKGVYEGTAFSGSWTTIEPDHLAVLPHVAGACSVAMGCGLGRVARAAKGQDMKLKDILKAMIGRVADTAGNVDLGMSDSDLNAELWSALQAEVPEFAVGYSGMSGYVKAVYQDQNKLVYCIGDQDYLRSYEVADDGTITLVDDAVEVEPFVEYRSVDPNAIESLQYQMTAASSSCGCGGKKMTSAGNKEDDMKSKYIARILSAKRSCFTEVDKPQLEAFSEERLKALAEHAEKEPEIPVVPPVEVKPETNEELKARTLLAFPDLAQIEAEHKARVAECRAELVGQLKGADAFTEEELNAMPLDQLEKTAKIAAKPAQVSHAPLAPRAASRGEDDKVPAPPSENEVYRHLRGLPAANAK